MHTVTIKGQSTVSNLFNGFNTSVLVVVYGKSS